MQGVEISFGWVFCGLQGPYKLELVGGDLEAHWTRKAWARKQLWNDYHKECAAATFPWSSQWTALSLCQSWSGSTNRQVCARKILTVFGVFFSFVVQSGGAVVLQSFGLLRSAYGFLASLEALELEAKRPTRSQAPAEAKPKPRLKVLAWLNYIWIPLCVYIYRFFFMYMLFLVWFCTWWLNWTIYQRSLLVHVGCLHGCTCVGLARVEAEAASLEAAQYYHTVRSAFGSRGRELSLLVVLIFLFLVYCLLSSLSSGGGAPSCDFLTCGNHAVCKRCSQHVLCWVSSSPLKLLIDYESVTHFGLPFGIVSGQTKTRGLSVNVHLGLDILLPQGWTMNATSL